MNSQRIMQKFGSYGVDVLHADKELRVSSLYSESEGQHITRTLALVSFYADMSEPFKAIHRQVVNGASIGATFQASGWKINKELLGVELLRYDPAFSELYRWMALTRAFDLPVHIYVFRARMENSEWMRYATIAEIHSPTYLTAQELRHVADEVSKEPSDLKLQTDVRHLLREFLLRREKARQDT